MEKLKEMADFGLVTVLMSVYRTGAELLERSVMSILNQTYSNIEFIIIDDGADQECVKYLENIVDGRVHIIRNEENIGLAASLNKGLSVANGKYIARMDADDYSLPLRIYEQAKYLNENENIDVVACIAADIKNGKLTGKSGGAYRVFNNEDMRIQLSLAPMPFPHPGVMFRADFLRENKLKYDEGFARAQDYNMWARCVEKGNLASVQKVLLYYDVGNGQDNGPSEKQTYYSNLTKIMCLERLLPDATDKQKELYVHMRDVELAGTVHENIELVRELIKRNELQSLYNSKRFSKILYFWWGRKILYKENRKYMAEFVRYPSFLAHSFRATLTEMPGHIMQQVYIKRISLGLKGVVING